MTDFHVAVGDTHTFSKTVSESDVYLFAGITGDLSPNHVDEEAMRNPKMIPFFIALFPQFVHPERGALVLQSLVLGITLAGMAVAWIGALVLLVGRFRAAVASSTTFLKLANRLAALTFLGLACRLAVQER